MSYLTVLVIGVLIGTFVMTLLESFIPHADLDHSQHTPHNSKVIILFLIAMSLHNLPEGLSVGISNASTVQDIGPLVSFAIGLQNVPEGFLVAIFLVKIGRASCREGVLIYVVVVSLLRK